MLIRTSYLGQGRGAQMPREAASNRRMAIPWFALSVASCAIAMAIILYGYAYSFDRLAIDGWRMALCLFVLLVISLGSLAREEVIPWKSRRLSDWLQWKALGAAVYALMLGALSAATIVQLLDPKEMPSELVAANANAARAAGTSERILRGMAQAGLGSSADDVLAKGLAGVWGERGCQVTYRVTLDGSSLTIRSLKDPPGLEPFRQVVRLAPARATAHGGVTAMAEVIDGPDVGSSLIIGYEKIGGVERMLREQKMPQHAISFDRCSA